LRRPSKPKTKVAYHQCHFKWMRSLSTKNDVGSTRSIKCLDENGKRYPMNKETGETTCPICKCNCEIAYQIGAHQAVMHKKCVDSGAHAIHIVRSVAVSQQKATSVVMDEFGTVVDGYVDQKITEADRKLKAYGKDGLSRKEVEGLKIEGYNRAAYNVAREIDDNVDRQWIRMNRLAMCIPTTKVCVSSNAFDTRSLASRLSNHRAVNTALLTPSTDSTNNTKPPLRPHKDEYVNLTFESPEYINLAQEMASPFEDFIDLSKPKVNVEKKEREQMIERVKKRTLNEVIGEEVVDSSKARIARGRHRYMLDNPIIVVETCNGIDSVRNDVDSQDVKAIFDRMYSHRYSFSPQK